MDDKPYFPPLYGNVDCSKCEKKDCMSRGKYQRNRRDFSYTSGRCPRLPDHRGFMEKEEQLLYAATFPMVCAERGGDDTLILTLQLPGIKRGRKVYFTKICGGYWYFREKAPEGYTSVKYFKRVLYIEDMDTVQKIRDHMDWLGTDYCLLRCTIEDCVI